MSKVTIIGNANTGLKATIELMRTDKSHETIDDFILKLNYTACCTLLKLLEWQQNIKQVGKVNISM